MENAEEIMHFLELFTKCKSKTIPPELNDYLSYVARTGDPLFHWGLVKSLFKEKLLCVLSDYYENSPGIDIPAYSNVDDLNYDSMKNCLLERLDKFLTAPFTLQRISELLINPRRHYNRVNKFMRAIEKNILVVSTTGPGTQCIEQNYCEPADAIHIDSDENESKSNQLEELPSSSDEDVYDDSKSSAGGNVTHNLVAEYESVTPLDDSANDKNYIQESASTATDDKTDVSSSNSDEVMSKTTGTENYKDEDGKPFDIPKMSISIGTDQKNNKTGVGETTEADEIGKKEATVIPTDDKKSLLAVIETDDVTPSDDVS